jgi:hypothetical protein
MQKIKKMHRVHNSCINFPSSFQDWPILVFKQKDERMTNCHANIELYGCDVASLPFGIQLSSSPAPHESEMSSCDHA